MFLDRDHYEAVKEDETLHPELAQQFARMQRGLAASTLLGKLTRVRVVSIDEIMFLLGDLVNSSEIPGYMHLIYCLICNTGDKLCEERNRGHIDETLTVLNKKLDELSNTPDAYFFMSVSVG